MEPGNFERYSFIKFFICILLSAVSIAVQQNPGESGDMNAEDNSVAESSKVKIIYFTSSSCDECMRVKNALPDLIADFEGLITIEKFDIDESDENLAKLLDYLDEYGLEDVAPPVMFIGEKSLVDDEVIIDQLQETLIEAIVAHMPEMPESEPAQEQNTPTTPPDVYDANAITAKPDEGTAADVVSVEPEVTESPEAVTETNSLEITDSAAASLETEASITDINTIALENILHTIENVEPQLSTLPESEPNEMHAQSGDDSNTQSASEQNSTAQERILEQFNKFSVGAIAAAGLLDGINPCAFTTIVFFISMLAYLGKSKRQIIIVGTGFTFAVFVTYLLIGLGLLGTVKSFFVTQGISRAVTRIVAVLTFLLAAWSLWDLLRYLKTKDTRSMTLGLPKSVKARIHKVIRVGMSTRGLLTGALGVGVLVALLESVCTGQIYLPVIIYVAKSSTFRIDAIGYLLLYNLMFIVPLIVIFIITYFGVSSQTLGNFLGRHIVLAKLIMVLLFIMLGMMLLLV